MCIPAAFSRAEAERMCIAVWDALADVHGIRHAEPEMSPRGLSTSA